MSTPLSKHLATRFYDRTKDSNDVSPAASSSRVQPESIRPELLGLPHRPAEAPPESIALVHFAKNLGRGLKKWHIGKNWKPFLDVHEQARLNVFCKGFDPRSRNVTPFLEPVPLATMQEWLDSVEPWQRRGFGSGRGELTEWHNARALCSNLAGYLSSGETTATEGISDMTMWERRLFHMNMMGARTRRLSFDIDYILDYTDTAFPHVGAILHQTGRLVDGELGAAELLSICQLTVMRALAPLYYKHTVIPVTLVSLADCDARILLVYFDLQSGQTRVYKSPISTFDKPGGFRRDDWKLLLCWLLATPRFPKVQ
ncbi:hypothetical protein SPI_01832 [Niveomyces insectorum RCEF 264]|uniref:Uncharacterized protein n=1 Tax=Niveomyces insectorum RCEF 264 TaxID=1081102 RepID=A0A167Z9U9_9HYPO|nr:hypothetical protein SPI_01832 [Niveomyces insectorum RCEF 264]